MDPNVVIEPKIVVEQLMANYRYFHGFLVTSATAVLSVTAALFVGFAWLRGKMKISKHWAVAYAVGGIVVSFIGLLIILRGVYLVTITANRLADFSEFKSVMDAGLKYHGWPAVLLCLSIAGAWSAVLIWIRRSKADK